MFSTVCGEFWMEKNMSLRVRCFWNPARVELFETQPACCRTKTFKTKTRNQIRHVLWWTGAQDRGQESDDIVSSLPSHYYAWIVSCYDGPNWGTLSFHHTVLLLMLRLALAGRPQKKHLHRFRAFWLAKTVSNSFKQPREVSNSFKQCQTASNRRMFSRLLACKNSSQQFQTASRSFKQFQTVSNSFKQANVLTFPGLQKQFQTVSNSLKHFQTVSNSFKHFQTVSNSLKQSQAVPNSLKQFQTVSNSLKQFQTVSTGECFHDFSLVKQFQI